MPRVSLRQTNTNDPVLSRIQDAMDMAVRDLDTYKEPRAELNRSVATESAQARPGEIVETNSTIGNVFVAKPPVLPNSVGLSFWVVRRSAANNVTVGTDALPSALGIWEFKQASDAWWRVAP